MKWYVCPHCKVSRASNHWDEATEQVYGSDIYSVEDDTERNNCIYVCPHCGYEVSGHEVKAG